MQKFMYLFGRGRRKTKYLCATVVAALILALSGTAFAANGKPSDATSSQTMLATLLTAITACVFLIVTILLALRKGEIALNKSWQKFLFAAVCAAVIRLIGAAIYPGFRVDLAAFSGWSDAAYKYGLSDLYSSKVFIDYPPGYMYVMYVVGFLKSVLGAEPSSALSIVLVKIPPITADIITAGIVYRLASREKNSMFGLLCSCLILFNPAMFFNSAIWAQMDSVFILFIVLNLYYLYRERYILGAVFFAVALLIKPQAVLFLPVVGLAYLYSLSKKGELKKAFGNIFGGVVIGAAVFVLGVLPFTLNHNPVWILDKYINTMGSFQYYSLNAFNIYSLVGLNIVDFGYEPLSNYYKLFTFISVAIVCAVIAVLQWRAREKRPMFELGAFLIISIFMFVPMMHERYILPGCVLLVFVYIYSKDLITLFFGCAFSFTALISDAVVLYRTTTLVQPLPAFILSAVYIGLYVAYAILTAKKLSIGKVLNKSPGLLDQTKGYRNF